MYALLGKDNKTVIGYYTPDIPEEEVIKDSKGWTVIKMTVENSPAGIHWTYENGKFTPPADDWSNGGKG